MSKSCRSTLLAFGAGAEVRPFIALTVFFGGLVWLRQRPDFQPIAANANAVLFGAGSALLALQTVGFFTT